MDFEDVERSEAVFPQDGNRSNLERQTFLTNEPLPSKFGGLAAVIQAYPSTLIQREGDREKLLLVLVGLPARGKTYISRKLTRYLQWIGYNTSAFNVGSYRRKKYGTDLDFTFFDPNNAEGVEQRKVCAEAALSDCLEFLSSGGQIGILDGTNSTKERQDGVISQVEKFMLDTGVPVKLVWIESTYTDQQMIDSMIRENLLFSPDYASMKSQDAVEDIKKRIANHEKIYSPLSDEMQTYIRILNGGRQLIVNKVNGYVLGKIVFFLMNLRANHAPIYITRHGESEFNVEGKIGGDTNLSTRGREYAKMLGEFIKAQQEEFNGNDVKVWCSTLKRTIETASFISGTSPMQWRALSEIEVGTCDGMTYKEIESFHPEEFKARKADKLRYRYPRGESYLDVIQRLEPVIFELERATTPVLVIGHRAVLRCLYAYFVELPAEDVPHIKIPLHTVIKMIPKSYGTEVKTLAFDIASVDQETDQLLT